MRATLLVSLALALACSGGVPSVAPPPPPPPVVNLAGLFPPGRPAIPAPFKGVRPHMTKVEALAALPSASFTDPSGGDALFALDFNDTETRVESLTVQLPAETAESLLTTAWGAPVKARGQYAPTEKVLWWNPDTGIRAQLGAAIGPHRTVSFTRYTPTDTFLGAGTAIAAASAESLLGKSLESVAAAYPDTLVVSWNEAGKPATTSYAAWSGTKPGVDDAHTYYLELLPTEYADFWTRVNLEFGGNGTVIAYTFGLMFEGNASARESFLQIFKRKFGTEGESTEIAGRSTLVFAENPRVEVYTDELTGQVVVKVGLARAGRAPGSMRPNRREGQQGQPGQPGSQLRVKPGAGRPRSQ